MNDKKSELEKQADEFLKKHGVNPDSPEDLKHEEITEDEAYPERDSDGKPTGKWKSANPDIERHAKVDEAKKHDDLEHLATAVFGADAFSLHECLRILGEFRERLSNHPRRALFQPMFRKPMEFITLWRFLFACSPTKFISIIILNPVAAGLATAKEAEELDLAIEVDAEFRGGKSIREITKDRDEGGRKKITRIHEDYRDAFRKFDSLLPSDEDVINEAYESLAKVVAAKALKSSDSIVQKLVLEAGKRELDKAQQASDNTEKKARAGFLKHLFK